MGNVSSSDSDDESRPEEAQALPPQDGHAPQTLRAVTDQTYAALTDHDKKNQVIYSSGKEVFVSWLDAASNTPRAALLHQFPIDRVPYLIDNPHRPLLDDDVVLGSTVSGSELRQAVSVMLDSGKCITVHGETQKLTGHVLNMPPHSQ